MEKLLIKNGRVLLFENEDVIIKSKDILVEEGKITKIEDDIPNSIEYHLIDAKDHVVMPGLINTHTHIPMSIFRETSEGVSLNEWLQEKIWPIEDRLTKEDIYNASMLSLIEMISTGTTCINDQYFISEQIRECVRKLQVRAVLTRVIMDVDNGLEKRVDEFKNFYETRLPNEDLITYTVSPHGLYTCTDKSLKVSVDLAKQYNLPIHIHFLESIDEIKNIEKLHGKKPIEVLKQYFEGIHTILAHSVKLDDEDIKILKTLDCGIAHNPISNLRLGCKIADTTKYLQQGLNVALGTDGQGSGSNLDMFETMKMACLIQGGIHENEKRITAKDVIRMATINGAKLLGLEHKIGSIEVGKDADIILVDISKNLDNIIMYPNSNEIANLVYNTSGRNVTTTIIRGNVLMENRIIKGIDVNEIIKKAEQIIMKKF